MLGLFELKTKPFNNCKLRRQTTLADSSYRYIDLIYIAELHVV